MKNVKQIRESYDLITEKEEAESRKLSSLVRAGLYDAKKLPALKKALEKSSDKMTGQEKRMLLNLLDSLIDQVVGNDQVFRKVKQNVQHVNEAKEDYLTKFDPRAKPGYPSDRDIPTVLILKRKAIRVYPDNQKVALYYSQALDKYVTIPFSDIQVGLNEEKEEDKELNKRLRRSTSQYKAAGEMLKTGKIVGAKRTAGEKWKQASGGGVKAIHKDVKAALGGNKYSTPIALGATAGGTIHNLVKGGIKKSIQKARVAKKLQQRGPRPSQAKTEAPVPVAAPEPAKMPTENKPQASAPVPVLKTRKGKAARARAAQIEKKNPAAKQGYTAGAIKAMSLSEQYRFNLQQLREQKQLEEGKVSDFAYNDLDDFSATSLAKDFTPGLGTARAAERTKRAWKSGSYGSAALNALDTALSGVSDAALATGIGAPIAGAIKGVSTAAKGAVKGGSAALKAWKAKKAASATKKADDVADVSKARVAAAKADNVSKPSGPKKRGWGSAIARGTGKAALKTGRIATKVAAGAVGALGSGGSDNSHILSKSSKPELGKSSLFKSTSSFDDKQNQASSIEVQNKKIARQAMQVQTEENAESNFVLSRSSKPKFGLQVRSKSSREIGARAKSTQGVRDERQQRLSNLAMLQREDVISNLKSMVESNIPEQTLTINEQEININTTAAKKILHVYESVNSTNKKKMEKMLNESAESFNKVLTFAIRQ